MTLNIATNHAFRSTDELEQLVRAVLAAKDNDENRWLEWKSTHDLTKSEALFAIAKAVLGFANRTIIDANKTCEGTAYLVVGAEHDHGLLGVEAMDGAPLGQKLKTYIGGAVRWTPAFVEIDGKSVLVATVDAPRPGDSMHTLRKDYDKFHAGTIFVRHSGRTERAGPEEIRLLEERLLAGVQDPEMNNIKVEIGSSPDGGVCKLDDSDAAIADWVSIHKQSMEKRSVPPRTYGGTPVAGWDIYKAEFDAEMDSYLREVSSVLPWKACQELIDDCVNDIRITVKNTSAAPITGVQITLSVPSGTAEIYGRLASNEIDLPQRPHWPTAQILTPPYYRPPALRTEYPEVTYTESDGVYELRYLIGDLRPGEKTSLQPLAVRPSIDAGDSAEIHWSVTSMNRSRQIDGTLHLPINNHQVLDLSLAGDPTDI